MPLTIWVLVAAIACLIVWHIASELDRRPQSAGNDPEARWSAAVAIGALIAAAGAVALFQVSLLEGLRASIAP